MTDKKIDGISVRKIPGQPGYELAHPRCVRDRADDMAEVHAMLAAGEIDVAVDELRWLLGGCYDLLEAHKLLGEIATADGDTELARSHFGYAYDLGQKALPKSRLGGPLPYGREANRHFFEASKGLAACLIRLGQQAAARKVVNQLLRLDPQDPLKLGEMLKEA